MDLQKLLLKNPKLVKYTLENINPSLLVDLGKKKAFKAFQIASKVKAYQELMEEKGVQISSIQSEEDFRKLPIIDKQSYILKYPLGKLLKVDFAQNYTIEESSGYGGKSCFWLRYSGQDDAFVNYAEVGLVKTYNVKKKSTLVINTFALGTWVTGVKFARALCGVANKKDIKMTVANTGMVFDSAIKIIENFADEYDQVLLAGYPPFVKGLVEDLIEKKTIKNVELHIMVGAESFPEEWRDYMTKLLQTQYDYEPIILSAYGAADVGLELGYEQPITKLFRNLLRSDKDLRYEVLGEGVDFVPHFFQYNPLNIWVEEVDGELIYTSNSGIPVVRYNLHDAGGIISYEKFISILDRKYDIKKILNHYKPFHMPILFLRGRTDGVIPISGANLYIEQVRSALEKPSLQKYLTGGFYSFSKLDDKFLPQFHIIIEVDDKNIIGEKEEALILKEIVKTLCKLNQDYRAFYNDRPAQYKPILSFVGREEFSKYRQDSLKIKYIKN